MGRAGPGKLPRQVDEQKIGLPLAVFAKATRRQIAEWLVQLFFVVALHPAWHQSTNTCEVNSGPLLQRIASGKPRQA